MNEELTHQLTLLISNLNSALVAGGHLIVENLPPALESYVMYGRIFSTVIVVMALIILIASAYSLVSGIRRQVREEEAAQAAHSYAPSSTIVFVSIFAGVFGSLIGLMVVASNLGALILVWAAPQVWLIRQAAHLLH